MYDVEIELFEPPDIYARLELTIALAAGAFTLGDAWERRPSPTLLMLVPDPGVAAAHAREGLRAWLEATDASDEPGLIDLDRARAIRATTEHHWPLDLIATALFRAVPRDELLAYVGNPFRPTR